MKVNLDQVLFNLDGTPIKNAKGGDFTMKECAVGALVNAPPQEQITGEEKFARWELASMVSKGGEMDLSIDEIAKIKKVVGVAFQPGIVGPAFECLEGTSA